MTVVEIRFEFSTQCLFIETVTSVTGSASAKALTYVFGVC